MSRVCPITGKRPMYGNNRSHSLRATRRRWNVNLQKATIMVNGKKTKVRVSTSALRTLRKNNKLVKPVIAPQAAKAPVAEEKPVEAAKVEETKAEAPKAEPVAEVKAAPKAKKAAPKKAVKKAEEKPAEAK